MERQIFLDESVDTPETGEIGYIDDDGNMRINPDALVEGLRPALQTVIKQAIGGSLAAGLSQSEVDARVAAGLNNARNGQ